MTAMPSIFSEYILRLSGQFTSFRWSKSHCCTFLQDQGVLHLGELEERLQQYTENNSVT